MRTGGELALKIIHQLGKQYVLVASAEECRLILAQGLEIEDVGKYGVKAVKGKPNKTYDDNLRQLPDIRDPGKLERIKAKYAKLKAR